MSCALSKGSKEEGGGSKWQRTRKFPFRGEEILAAAVFGVVHGRDVEDGSLDHEQQLSGFVKILYA